MTAIVFENPARVRATHRALADDLAALAFHRKLPAYAPTPLVDAPALARDLGLEHLWVKVDSERL